jgi:hypothetical protein
VLHSSAGGCTREQRGPPQLCLSEIVGAAGWSGRAQWFRTTSVTAGGRPAGQLASYDSMRAHDGSACPARGAVVLRQREVLMRTRIAVLMLTAGALLAGSTLALSGSAGATATKGNLFFDGGVVRTVVNPRGDSQRRYRHVLRRRQRRVRPARNHERGPGQPGVPRRQLGRVGGPFHCQPLSVDLPVGSARRRSGR